MVEAEPSVRYVGQGPRGLPRRDKAYKAQQNPILPGFHADPEILYSNLTTPYSYMRSLVTDDLKIILSGNDLTSCVKPGDSTTEGSGGSLESGSNGTIEA